jgi:mercuric reductase
MQTFNLRIGGMTCQHCATAIERALSNVPGVNTASVSYADKEARVEIKHGLNADTLIQAVQASGYNAKLDDKQPVRHEGNDSKINLVILGSGSAAFAAALEAVSHGAQVTMIETSTVGGTCVNVGCVPSKIMIRGAQIAHQQAQHLFSGIERHAPTIDRARLVEQQQARVDELRHEKYESILASNPEINLVRGRARLAEATTVEVTKPDGTIKTFKADRILISTGRSPVLPNIDGLAETPYWTSTTALIAPEIPEHLIVLGASVVAVELAHAFLRLGSKVTMLARSIVLSQEDPDIAKGLHQALEAEDMNIMTQAKVSEVRHDGRQFHIAVNGQNLIGDKLLVAAGRIPNTADLGLEAVGVNITSKGEIVVDSHMRTSVSHIYAAGDCTPLPQYVYVAAAAGKVAAQNLTGGNAEIDLLAMPEVIFTDPQVATAGLTEQQALAQGLQVESRTLGLENVPRALANFDTNGFIKLVAEKESGRIVGAQILAAEASEMIQTAVLAIRHRMTVHSLAQELFPYLTMVEGLKLCALTFFKDVKQLSCCAG